MCRLLKPCMTQLSSSLAVWSCIFFFAKQVQLLVVALKIHSHMRWVPDRVENASFSQPHFAQVGPSATIVGFAHVARWCRHNRATVAETCKRGAERGAGSRGMGSRQTAAVE